MTREIDITSITKKWLSILAEEQGDRYYFYYQKVAKITKKWVSILAEELGK